MSVELAMVTVMENWIFLSVARFEIGKSTSVIRGCANILSRKEAKDCRSDAEPMILTGDRPDSSRMRLSRVMVMSDPCILVNKSI